MRNIRGYWGVLPNLREAAVHAAVAVAGRLGLPGADPVVLADGANVIVRLSPSPVVAKVAASTAVIRPDTAGALQRELDAARFLAAAGAPVLTPAPEVPAVVHRHGDQVMSFWRYVGRSDGPPPGEDTIGSMLRDLHQVLRGYRVPLPTLTPLDDIPAFLARPRTVLGDRDRAALTAAHARLAEALAAAAPTGQVLHGDAGAGNLMRTPAGWIWHDFEDVCRGPVAWDVAAATASPRLSRDHVLSAYGDPVDTGLLDVCEQLRGLHLTVWYALYAERLPQHGERAAELLAAWPVP
ncbi:MAG: phosphotransferase [Streptosporangiaceae bacterium]